MASDHSNCVECQRGDEGAQSLFEYIDTARMSCLNEERPGMAKNIIKPFDQRLDIEKFLESGDEQMIINIPFTACVKITSISLRACDDGSCPSLVKAYINRNDVAFGSENTPSLQDFEIPQSSHILEFPTKPARFSNVHNLVLFVVGNHGGDTSRLYYLGLKGEFMASLARPVVAVYESAARTVDHAEALKEYSKRMSELDPSA